ncbi:chaperone protein dnaJ C76, chloroplastic isoform X2 [Neltuma alba]|uniref:chaperone protein dnaJ C76, chloroplastic isoform X2 n=1 Tax=Neltuma alba TaxID=207710 RepID=UPI0010A4A275|nr:chaperone protein dnaJ C76, chloroplastic isoform X2 [Prosopis alba]
MHCTASARLLPLPSPLSSRVTRTELTTPKSCSRGSILTCRAVHSASSITEFDLYDLLGIDSCSDQSQIKLAYRSLQKRCHPDIAGPAGHQMAIILNEAYAVLSDPSSRLAYDKEQKKIEGFKGFTGRPVYSVWFGSESEQRAIFVDEIKCVGCLKCALLAEKTFAIESVYGRARVVGQWADSEDKIQEAIDSCPVNCISVVERSNLAALEFLMSKQPRGNVRVGTGNTVGARVSNIFTEVQKFQTRFQEAMEKASNKSSKVIDPQREARISAIQAIRSISNWLYWRSPVASGASSGGPDKSLTRVARRLPEPNIDKLRDAAARKQLSESKRTRCQSSDEEYWAPSAYALPSSTENTATPSSAAKPSSSPLEQKEANERESEIYENQNNPIRWAFPMVTAMIAVATVRLHGGGSVHELNQHAGGSLALDIVNSPWSQGVLAAATWYMIGLAVVDLVAIIGRKNR